MNYASESSLNGCCDICGFRYKLSDLRALVVDYTLTDIRACPSCWNEDHPQYGLKYLRDLTDPYPARDPRPGDIAEAPTWFGWSPVSSLEAVGELGTVTTA